MTISFEELSDYFFLLQKLKKVVSEAHISSFVRE
jgi:hypothetical protein